MYITSVTHTSLFIWLAVSLWHIEPCWDSFKSGLSCWFAPWTEPTQRIISFRAHNAMVDLLCQHTGFCFRDKNMHKFTKATWMKHCRSFGPWLTDLHPPLLWRLILQIVVSVLQFTFLKSWSLPVFHRVYRSSGRGSYRPQTSPSWSRRRTHRLCWMS